MDDITPEKMLSQALKLYDLKQPEVEFIRHNENLTYKITDIDKKYLLRIHKSTNGFLHNNLSDYSHTELISNEVEIISTLKNGTNLCLQTPVIGHNGCFVQVITGVPVTLLEWVEGENAQNVETTQEFLFNGGKMERKCTCFYLQKRKRARNITDTTTTRQFCQE